MSELIHKNDNRATIRWKLLTGVSALALTAYVSSASVAKADDADRPLIWVELGGDMEQIQGFSTPFTAPFMTAITPTPGPYSGNIFIEGQKPPRYALGLDGKITYQPEGSDWLFSAGIQYGRSHANKHIHHQSAPPTFISNYGNKFVKYGAAFADTKSHTGEKHTILDFQAGKDVGMGAFGRDGTSNINVGVRIANFASQSAVDIHGRPSLNLVPVYYGFFSRTAFHGYTMTAHAARSFKGVGPSLSWNASASLAGNRQDGELTLDWGIQGALLFGKQKAKTDHQSQSYYKPPVVFPGYYYTKQVHPPYHSTRARSVTVPNIGGYAGLSVKYTNVKFSLGYRYDTFLNAMDTGIDAAKKSNLTFNGPYVSFSVGIGD